MTDDLRTRIAAVICSMDALHAQVWAWDVAGEVIRELRQEWRADYGYDGYSNCTSREEAQEHVDDFNEHLGDDWQDGEQAMVLHRYVTEWVSEIRDDQEVRQ